MTMCRLAALLLLLFWGGTIPDALPRCQETPSGRETPDFALDVLPVLTRVGCNAGACHGAAKGQNNFKLSLLGYDPDSDHEALALELRSRRANRARPEDSLMLLKPTGKVSHGGGRVLKTDSDEYRLLLDWIRAGAPRKTRDARLEGILVRPGSRILDPGAELALSVEARYSDGAKRDVTSRALYSTNDDAIATITPEGRVRAVGRGETAIVVRYGGFVESALVGSAVGAAPVGDWKPANRIDEILLSKWRTLRIAPADDAPDAVFLRRVFLDTIGTLPTPAEARAFVADSSADKRAKLIDALLKRPEFDTFWTLKFSEWLLVGPREFPKSYPEWIRSQIARDARLTDFARTLITSQDPFFTQSDPRLAMEFTIQTFHGFRMQCANCHNHPLERFSQDDYHGLAAFYARVRWEGGRIVSAQRGDLTHPRTGKIVEPRFPGGAKGAIDGDRRVPFVDWLVSDRRFARAWANRLWGEIFGRGLVHPVDDMRASNPPSVPELLDALAEEFAKEPRLRPFLRLLLTSRAYAVGAKGTADDRFFAHAVVKLLSAEVLVDALARVTGDEGSRAIERFDPSATTYTLEAFGRCPRDVACTLKAEFGGSLRQALHIINDRALEERIRTVKLPTGDVVEELTWLALSRPPSKEERAHWGRPGEETARDLLWALIASKEFQFRH